LSAVLTTLAALLTALTTGFLLLLARLQPSVALLPVLALIAALTTLATLMLATLIVLVVHEFLLKRKGLFALRITSYSHARSKIMLFARDLGVLSS
jgi:hypothetical protein